MNYKSLGNSLILFDVIIDCVMEVTFQVNTNAFLCKTIDEMFEKGRDELDQSALNGLMQKVRC